MKRTRGASEPLQMAPRPMRCTAPPSYPSPSPSVRRRPSDLPRSPFALVALASALPAALHAQSVLNADVAVASAYVWRGVTFTNRPVIQPDAYLTLSAGRGTIVAGAAFNMEPRAYDGARDISVLGAESGTLVTATTLWSEYTRPVGLATTTLGVTGYLYPHAAGIAAAYNTAEVYGKVAFGGALAPSPAKYAVGARDARARRGDALHGARRAAPQQADGRPRVRLGAHAAQVTRRA